MKTTRNEVAIDDNGLELCSCTYKEIYKSDKHCTINYRGNSYKSIVDRIRVHYYNYINDSFIKL